MVEVIRMTPEETRARVAALEAAVSGCRVGVGCPCHGPEHVQIEGYRYLLGDDTAFTPA